jgi:hypothetical protein
MSIVFACIPDILKPKIKHDYPEITFLKVDMDESQHPKARKKREKKIATDSNADSVSTLPAVCSD